MYKFKKRLFTGHLSSKKFLLLSLLFLLCVTIICFLFTRKKFIKIELSNFSNYSFEELYKTNELVGIDIFYNKNTTDLKDAYLTTFELNFKNKKFEYLDYSYLFFDNNDSFEQKVDITRKGELLFPKKEMVRLEINYKKLLTLHHMKDMLMILENSDWIDFFNVSNEDDVEFKYIGLIEKKEEEFSGSDVYVVKENKIEIINNYSHLDYKKDNYLWIIRINNHINYVYIFS